MPSCVDESTDIEMRFKPLAEIQPDELALIETCLPDLLRELLQDSEHDDD